ncbi:Leukocyte receptor cluster member 8 [Amphibalanus amphitrite]|uniref:Leukocyte receptor cluster member 8 n=1 Tax=Amphibalanus amphitrite TaxID=1232801 RepID=A0A6A4VPD9_AMPAM|nr:Leukocyte receptor cluster member 8 [Amphibalanus amphitrite]
MQLSRPRFQAGGQLGSFNQSVRPPGGQPPSAAPAPAPAPAPGPGPDTSQPPPQTPPPQSPGQKSSPQALSGQPHPPSDVTAGKPMGAAPAGQPTNQAAESAANASSDWPDSLKRYVTRAFERAVSDTEKNRVQTLLREKITAAAARGPLTGVDWDKEPLPGSRSRSPDSRSGYGRSNRGRRRRNSSSGSSRDEDHRNTPRKKNNKTEKKKGRKDTKAPFYSLGGPGGATISTSEQLQKRASRFAGQRGDNKPRQRLQIQSFIQSAASQLGEDGEGMDWSALHIVGTCQDLEKRFLRLTAAPEAASVRPPEVLRRSLELVKTKWKEQQDYHNTCDQLKSIRQDLTVQGIRDEFTVHVYETHGRIALEKKDHTEFNQCQTQLKALYREVGGSNRLEFTAYRLLYFIFTRAIIGQCCFIFTRAIIGQWWLYFIFTRAIIGQWWLYFIFTRAIIDINTTLATLTDEDKRDPCVAHALKVKNAWSQGNYVRFFRLYQDAPKMSGFLMDWFADRERKSALKKLIKTYRPGVEVGYVCRILACSREQFATLTEPAALVYSDPVHSQLDCKASMTCLAAL